MNRTSPFAPAALLVACCGPAFAGEPPKCDESAKRAWYQRAVELTGGHAAPQEAPPAWCWLENPSARPAPPRSAARTAEQGSETPNGAFKTEARPTPGGALRSISIHDESLPAQD